MFALVKENVLHAMF